MFKKLYTIMRVFMPCLALSFVKLMTIYCDVEIGSQVERVQTKLPTCVGL